MLIKRFLIGITAVYILGCNDNSTNAKSVGSRLAQSVPIDTFGGKKVFIRLCAKCHSNFEKQMTDEFVFTGVFERIPKPSENYFERFIEDQNALRASGDKYANEMFKQWNTPYDHEFKDSLTLVELGGLIQYIKVVSRSKLKK